MGTGEGNNGGEGPVSGAPGRQSDTLKLWLGFVKFILGTLVLGAFSTYLAHRIQQQELDIKEQKQKHELRTAEQQYLERIADRVQAGGTPNRRVLAQMMTHVSQTQETRIRWNAYLGAIEADLKAEKAAAKEKDALLTKVSEQQKSLLELNAQLEEAKKQLTSEAKIETQRLQKIIAASRAELKLNELALTDTSLELARLTKELRPESTVASKVIEVRVDELLKNADLTGRRVTNVFRGGLDLRGIVFTGANLYDVGLAKGNLVNAKFDGARLQYVHLKDTNLYKADFRKAVLVNVDFTGANLREANFSEASITGDSGAFQMTFRRADLRGVKGLTCEMLKRTKEWELASRDPELACGAARSEETR